MGAYLCIASNGVPPSVSKRIMVNVHCEFHAHITLCSVASSMSVQAAHSRKLETFLLEHDSYMQFCTVNFSKLRTVNGFHTSAVLGIISSLIGRTADFGRWFSVAQWPDESRRA
jgi:hypothetical protein